MRLATVLSTMVFALALGVGCAKEKQAPPPEPAPPEQPTSQQGEQPFGEDEADDATLHSRVNEALEDAKLDTRNIEVFVRNGDVFLSGTVDSDRERQLAHNAAHGVEGVEDVYYSSLRVR